MEETNMDLTVYEPLTRGDPGQPGVLVRVGQSSVRGGGDGDQAATHVGTSQSCIRGGAGQASVRGGAGQSSVRGNDDQAPIIEKGVRGTVITVNRLKHYAFIKRKDQVQSRDIFAREASLMNEPHQRKFFISDTCKFDLIKTRRGLEAVNINIIERNINAISKLPKIPKKKKEKENEQTQVSTEFFQQTIAALFREVLNKKK